MLNSRSLKKLGDTSGWEPLRKKSFTSNKKNDDTQQSKKRVNNTSAICTKLTEQLKKRMKKKHYVPPEVSLDLTLDPETKSFDIKATPTEQGSTALKESNITNTERRIK